MQKERGIERFKKKKRKKKRNGKWKDVEEENKAVTYIE